MARKRKSKVTLQPQIEIGNLEPKPIEEKHIEVANSVEKLVNPVNLVSRLNYPITIKYDKSVIRISPRGRVKLADKDKIKSELPAGVSIVRLK